MNKWHGVLILLSLLADDLGLLRYSETCETISSIQCVNSTYFLWCVDPGNGTLVTIGNAEACPGLLVCDDTQFNGCVPANTVTTTELTSDLTTIASTDSTVSEESSTSELTSDSTAAASTDSTTSEESSTSESTVDLTTVVSTDSTTSEESATSESTADLTTVASTDSTDSELTSDSAITVSSTETTTDTLQPTTSEESDADFTCVYEGLYRANDCSRFHVCYKFIWFIKHYFARCSEGLYWSSVEKRCVLKSLSDCP